MERERDKDGADLGGDSSMWKTGSGLPGRLCLDGLCTSLLLLEDPVSCVGVGEVLIGGGDRRLPPGALLTRDC